MINIAFFSAKTYDKKTFEAHINHYQNEISIEFFDASLNSKTAELAQGFDVVCLFVNDVCDENVISALASHNVKHIALRCAGFNNVNLNSARANQIQVSRVPAYSPQAVAEHTVGLILTLGRKLHKAFNRVREGNFELEGLQGITLHKKTVGLIGTGNIGLATAKILNGFGCQLLCYDPCENESIKQLGAIYTDINTLYAESDIVSLHCPLVKSTHHLINDTSLAKMKEGVMLVNTSRGALIDTASVIRGLKSKKIGYLALDVYEMESELFFRNLSETLILDDQFERLSSFHNVLITGHQGFFTFEALDEIAETTVNNIIQQSKDKLSPPYLIEV
jgi:D-lactate dehydrogenase